ncbi:hypothetical protein KEM48_001893 [Puccinia striiformis f. sp. tritici PST-130]|nr:hypothetical protein KEM48_001893 [Puccinia striiformis f. sp. tritici PST-130]
MALHLALERARLSSVAPKHFQPQAEPPARLQQAYSDGRDPDEEKHGPHVMVIGSLASGKSTLIKTLANWAVKSGRTKLEGPGLLLVNLNPNDGAWTVPGTFSVAPLNVSIPTTTPVLPIGSTPTTGPPVLMSLPATDNHQPRTPNPALFAPALNALSFFYGHTQFSRNIGLAEILIKRVGNALETRIEKSNESALWRGGILIDTPAEFSEKGKGNLVKSVVRALGVNILVVIGNEKLHLEISKLMSINKTVQVVRVPKNGGATDLDLTYRRRLESNQIRSYFYGGPALSQGQLSPFTIVVRFEDLTIYRIGDEALVPSSALPIGATRSIKATSLTKVDPDNPRSMSNILNLVLSIPQAEWDGLDPESDAAFEACSGPSLGFIHLSSIDVKNRKYTILSPLPGRLPRKTAIVWNETEQHHLPLLDQQPARSSPPAPPATQSQANKKLKTSETNLPATDQTNSTATKHADLPVPSTSSDNHFFTNRPPKTIISSSSSEANDKSISLAQAVAQFTQAAASAACPPPKTTATTTTTEKPATSSPSSTHSQSALHPLLKQQQQQTPFATTTKNLLSQSPSAPNNNNSTHFEPVKFKTRSGGRPKDPVWVYFHTNGNGTDERATCKYCGWHVERPKAFRMRDHIAQCAQVDPTRRAEMSQLIAFKEAAAAAKQEEKAGLATATGPSSSSATTLDIFSSASKKRKMENTLHSKPALSFGKSPITSHVLDATSGKPGDDMGIRLDRLTANGFVLIANGTTDIDGRCNTLLPANSRPEIGIYKVTFFSNEFYQKRGIVSFYPFVEITFEIKDPTEHYHIPLLLSPYAFSTYRGS